ncbi:MAG: RHS repeat-associated core domain-containing protein [Clostridia bacterium]|nr:RHS repeat-associated core domain-containing protein [Clostridia bacterium]
MTNDKGYNNCEICYSNGKVSEVNYPVKKLSTTVVHDVVDRAIESSISFKDTSDVITNSTNYNNLFSDKITNEQVTVNDTELKTNYTYDAIDRVKTVEFYEDDALKHKIEYSFIPAKKRDTSAGGHVPFDPTTPSLPSNPVQTIGTTNYIGEIKETGYGSTLTTQILYDNNGNITKYGNNTYAYDSLNRLVRENNADLDKTIVYTYDDSLDDTIEDEKRNNLRIKQEYSYTTASTLTTPLSTTTFNVGAWQDQITGITKDNQTTTLSYDNKGRLTAFGNNAFTWDDNGRLTSVTTGNNCTQYFYDGDGNRVGKLFNDTSLTEFSYINGKLIKLSKVQETNPYSLIFLHDSTGIIGFKYNGEIYTYRKNLFGDITEIYKGTELVAKYVYDAWGNCTILQNNSDDIANVNPFRYRGYYYDIESGLYYLKSRYYDPTIGRFISPDGVEYLEPDNVLGLNLYAYCYNNPIMYTDPSGHFAIATAVAIGFWIGFGIGALAGATAGGIIAYEYCVENDISGWGMAGLMTLGILGGGYVGGAIGGAIGSAIGYGVGVVFGGTQAIVEGASIALYSGGGSRAAFDAAVASGKMLIRETFAAKTLTFAQAIYPILKLKPIYNTLWGKLSYDFALGASSAEIFLNGSGIYEKSAFYCYEIWALLERGVERIISYV